MESKGIDVSNYQGKIDWAKVKASGISFVIIRAGWGKTNIDPKFRANIEGALNVGLDVGVYWFLYAKNENDIVLNAKKCYEVIEPYRKGITMKVWADWEYDSDKYKPGLSKATRTEWVKKFCEEMKKYAYSVGVYANPDYLKSKFNDLSEYPLWLAYYATSKGKYEPLMWQYTSSGHVDGIVGRVDIDTYYGEASSSSPAPAKKNYPIIRSESSGEYVKLLQSILKDYGYDCGPIDGMFGPKTYKAVTKFQRDKGLDPDGIVGPLTWGELTK
jgi:GH25 family lysozyme M1 (1,4-beta-N-acetylmuramidase)